MKFIKKFYFPILFFVSIFLFFVFTSFSYAQGGCVKSGNSYVCDTALGQINTDPAGFIKGVMGLILGASGGIAVLLIIVSGYRIMTSRANPEALQGAREQLTSAIVGLLFIIFSLAILQIIGVDILQIPGFTK